MRRVLGVTACLMLALVLLVQAAHAGADDYGLFLEDVELRPGVTSDIHLKVFVNDQHPGMGKSRSIGKTVFAIPGWMHTAASWDQYAEALFAHPSKGVPTSRLVAIDLPGRGLSSPPDGIRLGELLLDDHVTAILATLDGLRGYGIYPQEIIGFSQGGALIQMVQQRLLDGGSSLSDEYGILGAVLLATGSLAPIDEGCDCASVPGKFCPLVAFLQTDSELGRYYDIPAWVHPYVFYLNWDEEPQMGTLTWEEIDSRGYRAPGPLFAAMQMVGYTGYLYDGQPYFPVPEVSPGIFGLQSGTLLHVVGFEDDTMCPASECEEVFDYLIGSPVLSRYTLVEAEDGVHDRVHMLPVTNPSVIIEAMSAHGWFVW